ncbi:DNA adenine methylase [Undibacterium amnicola]|uniref:site-specific DNA-methyltransferase (adenine-specific) n=1 Tax=Undibacterium amnicola TaxID=1834038 RepID=A0ABR6XSS5_9BURK|nr:DNA adenine methylase [Undibacterium amnicola]MBC3832418.1 DNA adenine methylase [Undibacterium amnicola]
MFRYFGSKASTSSQISQLISSLTPTGSVADAFGGLGTIGAELRLNGFRVTTCDVLTFPHTFQIARIEGKSTLPFSKLRESMDIQSMEQISSILNMSYAPNSWLVNEYAVERLFFTRENAVRIAGAWHQIKRWHEEGLLNRRERALLIASLLNSMDAVANTAGTYYAYLKSFHRKAVKTFNFEWFPVRGGQYVGHALLGDALSCLAGKNFDVLYLDPPYNNRNYASYYHLPESMSTLKQPKTNYERASGVPIHPHPASINIRDGMTVEYIEKLAAQVGWKWLIVHYCDGALIPLETMRCALKKFGSLNEFTLPALGYTTTKSTRTIHHHVFVVSASAN